MRSPIPVDEEHDSARHMAQKAAAASKITWISVAVNIVLSTVQILVGIFAKSQGLIADGVHSLSDLMADFAVLLANQHSRKDADTDHPYGHQRFETGASLVLGLLLLVVGIGMVWTAVIKLEHPALIPSVHLSALWVALAALVAKECLFRTMLRVATAVKSGMLVANAWHARSDAASSLVVACGIGGNLLGYPLLDPVAALIVGGMVGKMGWSFGWNALNDLMDRGAGTQEVADIHCTIAQTPGVLGVHDLKTRRMGDMLVVDAHIVVAADITVEAGHSISVEARRRVMQQHPVLNLMTHIDPADRPDLDHAKSQ